MYWQNKPIGCKVSTKKIEPANIAKRSSKIFEGAQREVKEETGLDVELQGERFPRESDCVRPYGIQINVIKEGEHEHMDLIYLAKPVAEEDLVLNEEETEGINWYSIAEA